MIPANPAMARGKEKTNILFKMTGQFLVLVKTLTKKWASLKKQLDWLGKCKKHLVLGYWSKQNDKKLHSE